MPKAPTTSTSTRSQPLPESTSKTPIAPKPSAPSSCRAEKSSHDTDIDTHDTDIDTKDPLPDNTSAPAGKVIDKTLALRLIIAKLEGSKNCDWYDLSVRMNRAGESKEGGTGAAGGKGKTKPKGAKGKGKGRKVKAEESEDEYIEGGVGEGRGKGNKGKKGAEGEWSGAELHDLYHNVVLPALKTGRPLWTDDTIPSDFATFYTTPDPRSPISTTRASQQSLTPSLPVTRTDTAMTGITMSATEVDDDVGGGGDDGDDMDGEDEGQPIGNHGRGHGGAATRAGGGEAGNAVEEAEGEVEELDIIQRSRGSSSLLSDAQNDEAPTRESTARPIKTTAPPAGQQRKLNSPITYNRGSAKRAAPAPLTAPLQKAAKVKNGSPASASSRFTPADSPTSSADEGKREYKYWKVKDQRGGEGDAKTGRGRKRAVDDECC